jgi:hypothetical protein
MLESVLSRKNIGIYAYHGQVREYLARGFWLKLEKGLISDAGFLKKSVIVGRIFDLRRRLLFRRRARLVTVTTPFVF